MATRNLVPRGNNEGSLGIDGQRWSALHVASISTDTLKVTNIQLKANDNLSLFTKGAGIEDISTNGDGQFVIAMDDTFLTNLGFNADGSSPGFEANGTVLAGDSIVTAINKLDTAVSGVAAPDDLTVASFDAAAITTSIELFADNDTTLMTSAAIDDRILSYGYTTNVGDITRIIADTGLDLDGGDGLSGDVTIKISNTTVAEGSYGSATAVPTFTVDAQGRLTAASTAAISTSFTLTDNQGTPNTDTFNNGGTLTFAGGTGLTSTVGNDSVTFDITSTGVTDGAYGSATQVATFTVNEQGQLTAAANAAISIPHGSVSDWDEAVQDIVGPQFTGGTHTGISATYTDATGVVNLSISDGGVTGPKLNSNTISAQGSEIENGLASGDEMLVSDTDDGGLKKMAVSVLQTFMQDNLTFTTNTDVDVSKANLSSKLASFTGDDTLNIGDADNDTNVVIRGNLTVQGTQTTVDSTAINIQNAFIFEGATDDNNETTLTTVDPTADRTIRLPNQDGYLPVLAAESATQITSTPEEINLLDGSSAGTVVNSKAVIYSGTGAVVASSFSGPLTGNVTGNASGNAGTATELETARAISLGGDLGGTANFDGSSDITINATIQAGSVENAMLASDGWSLSLAGVAQEDINLGDTLDFNGTASQVTIEYDAANQDLTFSLPATINVDTSGNAATATAWSNARTLTLGGDLTGNISIDGSQDVTLTATIADGSIENSMLADDAIGADELAANAVVNASIAAGAAIELDKLDWTSESAALTDFAQDDKLFIYDTDATAIKSMTLSNLEDSIFGNVSGDATIAAGGALTIAAGSVENAMLAGSIANDKLANSSINFGGISLALGGSDDTPAFDLTDATNYPTTSLVGTITNAQLAGSISDSKLDQITTADKVAISAIDINGATAIDNAIISTDLIIVDDGANGTNRKASFANVVTFLQDNTGLTSLSSLEGVGTITSGVWNGTAIADTYVANDLTLSGGTINDTPIGAVTHSTGKFTTLEATTSLKLSNAVTVTEILDEDAMGSNSATALATQQSIKAYVDNSLSGHCLFVEADNIDVGGVDNNLISLNLAGEERLQFIGGTGIDTTAAEVADVEGENPTNDTVTISIDNTVVATLTDTQTLTNKTLTSPTVSGLSLSDSSIVFEGATSDDFETTLSVTDPTADRTITIPDATDTLVGRATTDTLTNKTINADNNTITDLEVDNLKAGVLDTDLSAVAADDTTLASAKAIKSYVDGQLGRFGGIFLTSYNGDSDEYDVVFDSSPLVRSHFGPFAFDLQQLRDSAFGSDEGSDIIFYGATAVGASDRHFLVIGSGADKGDTKFTGADENTP